MQIPFWRSLYPAITLSSASLTSVLSTPSRTAQIFSKVIGDSDEKINASRIAEIFSILRLHGREDSNRTESRRLIGFDHLELNEFQQGQKRVNDSAAVSSFSQ